MAQRRQHRSLVFHHVLNHLVPHHARSGPLTARDRHQTIDADVGVIGNIETAGGGVGVGAVINKRAHTHQRGDDLFAIKRCSAHRIDGLKEQIDIAFICSRIISVTVNHGVGWTNKGAPHPRIHDHMLAVFTTHKHATLAAQITSEQMHSLGLAHLQLGYLRQITQRLRNPRTRSIDHHRGIHLMRGVGDLISHFYTLDAAFFHVPENASDFGVVNRRSAICRKSFNHREEESFCMEIQRIIVAPRSLQALRVKPRDFLEQCIFRNPPETR